MVCALQGSGTEVDKVAIYMYNQTTPKESCVWVVSTVFSASKRFKDEQSFSSKSVQTKTLEKPVIVNFV